MKLCKKYISVLCAALLFLTCTAFTAFAAEDEAKPAVYAEELHDGTYEIEVTSSASMFRVVHCELTVADGSMTAVMTLSGKGYEKLYVGTGEEALAADEADYIFFTENAEEKYDYTVPVEALNKDIACAAFSFKKQQWYDRVLVFEADSLPADAFLVKPVSASDVTPAADLSPSFALSGMGIVICVAVIAVAAAAVVLFLILRRKK